MQTLTIFGPNLNNQSKGSFHVHDSACRDCGKYSRDTAWPSVNFECLLDVASEVYSDHIAEGSMTVNDALQDIHFAPCVKLPMLPSHRQPC